MTTQTTMFPEDPCQAFHGNNPESRAAFEEILPVLGKLQQMVLNYAKECSDAGSNGITVKMVRAALNLEHQTASARLTELRKGDLIAPTEHRLDGCRVLQITELGQRTLRAWQQKNQ